MYKVKPSSNCKYSPYLKKKEEFYSVFNNGLLFLAQLYLNNYKAISGCSFVLNICNAFSKLKC